MFLYISIYLSIYLFLNLSKCLSIYLSICFSIFLSIGDSEKRVRDHMSSPEVQRRVKLYDTASFTVSFIFVILEKKKNGSSWLNAGS